MGRVASGSVKRYYVKDHLGSTRAVVNESGTVVERRDFDAYGMELAGRGMVGTLVMNERYTGHQWDAETGLLYAGARYLDPAIGRFLGTDPLMDMFPGWNPYNYAFGSPVMLTDPTGMGPCDLGDGVQRNCVDGTETKDVLVEGDRYEGAYAGYWYATREGKVVDNPEDADKLYVDASSTAGQKELYKYLHSDHNKACSVAGGSGMSMAARSTAMKACVHDKESFVGIMSVIGAPIAIAGLAEVSLAWTAYGIYTSKDLATDNTAGLLVNTIAIAMPYAYAARGSGVVGLANFSNRFINHALYAKNGPLILEGALNTWMIKVPATSASMAFAPLIFDH